MFPNGEVSVKEKKLDEGEKILSVNGIVKSHVLNGVCTALYNDNMMNIKYRYKVNIPKLALFNEYLLRHVACNGSFVQFCRMMSYHLFPASLYHQIHYHLHLNAS